MNICACVPDILYKKMCIESTLRSENVIKVGSFPPQEKVLHCNQTLIEIWYGRRVVVVGRLQWIYIKSQWGGRKI